jgi:pentatricopeptide repeat domain-containing protein 1
MQPDVISYSASISACEKGLQWEKALELLSEMKTQGFQPDLSFSVPKSAAKEIFNLRPLNPVRSRKDTRTVN